MGFSETMRDRLGAEGSQVDVLTPEDTIPSGAHAEATVRIHSGVKTIKIDALILRLIEARRHWTDSQGNALLEEECQHLPDRGHLTPVWTRRTVAQTQISVEQTIEAERSFDFPVELPVPESCETSSAACVMLFHAQADIKGQIDPTGTGKIKIA